MLDRFIDLSLTVQAFTQFAPHQETHIRQSLLQTDFFHQFEKGQLSTQEFYTGIRKQLDTDISDNQIQAAWNALLLEIPPKRIELLKKLQEKYRTFILSNTNILHGEAIEQVYPLSLWVEKVYYSHEMSARKPDPEIYEQVLIDAKLSPQETIFIDDNLHNIQAAEALGIRSLHLEVGRHEVHDFFTQDSSGTYHLALHL